VRRDDAWTRARKATEEMERHLASIARLADERALAIQELLDHGLTRSEVARGLGVTPAVITKILKRPVLGDVSHAEGTPGGSDVRELTAPEVKRHSSARR
jgi:DNA invertase Pin-like site-specific DNA recombinase